MNCIVLINATRLGPLPTRVPYLSWGVQAMASILHRRETRRPTCQSQNTDAQTQNPAVGSKSHETYRIKSTCTKPNLMELDIQ